jgi:hypothetical protein
MLTDHEIDAHPSVEPETLAAHELCLPVDFRM